MAKDGVNGKEAGASELPAPAHHDRSGATIIAATLADSKAEHPAAPPAATSSGGLKLDGDKIFTGPLLRQIRESQRITLKEVSERTKISVASLSALEEERYEDLPNARVYVRGFVRCLALEIGLDKDQVSRTYVPRWESWFYDHNHVTR